MWKKCANEILTIENRNKIKKNKILRFVNRKWVRNKKKNKKQKKMEIRFSIYFWSGKKIKYSTFYFFLFWFVTWIFTKIYIFQYTTTMTTTTAIDVCFNNKFFFFLARKLDGQMFECQKQKKGKEKKNWKFQIIK